MVDFSDPVARAIAPTTVQELTGDWFGYYQRSHDILPTHLPAVRSTNPLAPTQRLANSVYASTWANGLLAPSAKATTVANLVLFFGKLPAGALTHTGTASVVL